MGILFSVSYFMNKGKIVCPKTPEDQIILRLSLPGVLAGGKQTGAEYHKFVNGETVSVCCANVKSGPSPEREFKDCIHYNKEGKQDYQVVWEKKNGALVKIKEDLSWQGKQCIYNFGESGKWSGRYCYDPDKQVTQTNQSQGQEPPKKPKSYYDNITTSFPECDNLEHDSDKEKCYSEKAIEDKDSEICDYIKPKKSWSYSSKRDDCYAKIALDLNDISICDKMSSDSMIDDQRDKCYLNFLHSGDVSICEQKIKKQWNKESCYLTIADFTNNLAFCDKITDKSKKDLCMNVATN